MSLDLDRLLHSIEHNKIRANVVEKNDNKTQENINGYMMSSVRRIQHKWQEALARNHMELWQKKFGQTERIQLESHYLH